MTTTPPAPKPGAVLDVVLDCTTLFDMPVQTGIQRVVRRLIRLWPTDAARLHVARFDPHRGLVRVSGSALSLLLESRSAAFGTATDRIARRLLELSPPAQPPLPPGAPVLLPEVFFDPGRIQYYRAVLQAGRHPVAMLAYDFMPFLHSAIIDTPSVAALMGYLRLMTEATHLAFISDQTRSEYATRIIRYGGDPAALGPVLPLGADGLPAVRQAWHPGRRTFVCIGTVARRKNQHLVAEAFRSLWADGIDARLHLVGHDMDAVTPGWLVEILAHPNFIWSNAVSDNEAGASLDAARATIFASEIEGFGLPPIESLNAGVPVIATHGIPSLQPYGDLGQLRLPEVTVAHLRNAIIAAWDDAVAARLWSEAGTLSLPGWASFATAVATWCGTLATPRAAIPARSAPGG